MLIVHFRNVSAPGRYFEETLLEDGYMNMYDAMKQLVRCDYDGLIHVDHVPEYAISCGGKHSAMAYLDRLHEGAAALCSARSEFTKSVINNPLYLWKIHV